MSGKSILRVGDLCTGHDGYHPRPCIDGSPNVFINGIPVHRVGDHWQTHTDGNSSHGGVTIGGSSSIFCNGKAVARTGDAIDCGSFCDKGSANVFAG